MELIVIFQEFILVIVFYNLDLIDILFDLNLKFGLNLNSNLALNFNFNFVFS